MPELPEVETLRRDLENCVQGRVIVSARIHGHRTVRRHDPEELRGAVTGSLVCKVARLGKYLVIDLSGSNSMVVHLRMSGQLRLHDPSDAEARHTHGWFDLDDGRQLRFVDPRTFGELFICSTPQVKSQPGLNTLGRDCLTDLPTPRELATMLGRRRLVLKGFLLRQDLLAGIGNIYSDEICAAARLAHDRRTDELNRAEVTRLHRSITGILAEAVKCGGSSLRDAQYVDLFGLPGRYQDHHRVYGRQGEPCPGCGRPIQRRAFQQRSTFGCSSCQH